MSESLTKEERDHLLSLVTEEQKSFLFNKLNRGRETIFGNFMLSQKVEAIKSADEIELSENEHDVVDWKIVEFVDHGLGNRFGKCACGRTLRYEFTVQHTKTKKTITYGKDHLAVFLNLHVSDVDDVLNQLNAIDYELDEVLLKIKEDDYGYEMLDELPTKVDLPADIQEHVTFQIPLLNRQIRRLSKIIEAIEKEEWLNKLKKQSVEEYKAQTKVLQKVNQLIGQRLEREEKERKTNEDKLVEDLHKQLPFDASVGEIAFCFVKNGVSSAVQISHMMVKYFQVDKRVSIGIKKRPYIYTDVVLALMEYTKRGDLLFDEESSGMEDCLFFMNTERQPETNTPHEEVQITLF